MVAVSSQPSRPGKVSENQVETPWKYSPEARLSQENSGKAASSRRSDMDLSGCSAGTKQHTVSTASTRKKGITYFSFGLSFFIAVPQNWK